MEEYKHEAYNASTLLKVCGLKSALGVSSLLLETLSGFRVYLVDYEKNGFTWCSAVGDTWAHKIVRSFSSISFWNMSSFVGFRSSVGMTTDRSFSTCIN